MSIERILTDRNCPECNRQIFSAIIPFINKKVDLQCLCQTEKREKEEKERQEMDKRKRINELFENSKFPKLQRRCLFSNFVKNKETERIFKACLNFAENFNEYEQKGKGIIFCGNTGSGKTHLACAIGNYLIEKEINVIFQNVSDLYFTIKKEFSNDKNSNNILDECKKAKLLILDDIGIEKPSQWNIATMHYIINSRYNDLKPTIITTNLSFQGLSNVLDSRTTDRLSDNERFASVVLNEESFRRVRS